MCSVTKGFTKNTSKTLVCAAKCDFVAGPACSLAEVLCERVGTCALNLNKNMFNYYIVVLRARFRWMSRGLRLNRAHQARCVCCHVSLTRDLALCWLELVRTCRYCDISSLDLGRGPGAEVAMWRSVDAEGP